MVNVHSSAAYVKRKRLRLDPPLPREAIGLELAERIAKPLISRSDPPFAIQPPGEGWLTAKLGTLSARRVQGHLCREYALAQVPWPFTRVLIIDLDAHGGESWDDVSERAEAVMAAFPDATPIRVSSPGGGIHLWYLLTAPAWSEGVERFATDCLEARGLEVGLGHIEIRPHGKTAIRLPLGPGSRLLDSNFEPTSMDPRDAVADLDFVIRHSKYDPLEIPETYRVRTKPPSSVAKRGRSATGRVIGASEFMHEVADLLHYGLREFGTRHEAMEKIYWYARVVLRLEADGARDFVVAWLDEGHNESSTDWPAKKGEVLAEIDRLARGWQSQLVAERRGRGTGGRLPLEHAEAHVADLGLVGNPRQLLARILEYAAARGSLDADGTVLIEIPRRTWRGWVRNYKPARDLLIRRDYLQLASNYSTHAERCRTWRLLPDHLCNLLSPKA